MYLTNDYFKLKEEKIYHFIEETRKVEQIKKQQFKFRKIIDLYDGSNTVSEKALKGDELMDKILSYLSKLYRPVHQVEFHRYFLSSCLRLIYGDAYKENRHRVMQKYSLESRKQQILICCPRRFGKTWGVAFFAAVVAIVLPGIEISIFSPGKRQSCTLISVIKEFIRRLHEDERLLNDNVEKILLRSISGKTSKINGYPSCVKTLKGVSGNILILEEMAVLDNQVFFEVVVPLHQLESTTIIGISTITNDGNYMTRFMDLKDEHGEPVFFVKHVYLACESCRKAKKASSCTHSSFLLPNWSSGRKRKVVNAIMQEHEELLAREIGGVANELNKKAFDIESLKRFEQRPRIQISNNISYPFVFISIDPNACGKTSDYAVISFIRFKGKVIVIGMESLPSVSHKENDRLLVDHIKRMETNSNFLNAKKIILIESNLGNEASRTEEELTKHKHQGYIGHKIHVIHEEDTKVGFRTDQYTKEQAVFNLRLLLSDDNIDIASEKSFVSIHQPYNTVLDSFFKQLSNFAEVVKESNVPGTKAKRFFSGKDYGSKDDLVMSFINGLLWSQRFLTENSFHIIRDY